MRFTKDNNDIFSITTDGDVFIRGNLSIGDEDTGWVSVQDYIGGVAEGL
jgi:hypothetical protein